MWRVTAEVERPAGARGDPPRFGSDVVAEALRSVGVEYIALNPGAGYRGQLTETMQIRLSLDGPDDLRKFLAEQIRTWGGVVREHNIKME